MNLLDAMIAAYVAYGANRGRQRGLADESYRLFRLAIAFGAGCGLYGLVSDALGKALSLGSVESGPVAFVATTLGAWALLRSLKGRFVAFVAARYAKHSAVGGAIAGGLRNLILSLSGLITAHLAGRNGGWLDESALGSVVQRLLGN